MIITRCNESEYSLSSNSDRRRAATVTMCSYGASSISSSLGLDNGVSIIAALDYYILDNNSLFLLLIFKVLL